MHFSFKKKIVINFQFVTFIVNIASYSVPMITVSSLKDFLTLSCIFFSSISSEYSFNTYILLKKLLDDLLLLENRRILKFVYG